MSQEHSARVNRSALSAASSSATGALLRSSPLRRLPRVLVGAGIGASVLLLGLVLLLRTPSRPAGAPRPPPPPPRQAVHWSLRSVPEKAEVVRESDGAVVGTTPWQRELLGDRGVETYLVRAPGYFDGRVSLDRGRSTELTTTLKIDDDSPYWPKPKQRSGKAKPAGKAKNHGKTLLVD
jgi:hypothetical protein